MDGHGEIEPKAFDAQGVGEREDGFPTGRPLSWGEREAIRRKRNQSSISQWVVSFAGFVGMRAGRLLRAVGMLRHKVVVDGVVYRACTNTSLRRSLMSSGSGVKEYDAAFRMVQGQLLSSQYPPRESMRIRYTNKRIYSDLGHDPRERFIELIKGHIRPGDRVLDLGCGTGAGSAQLSQLVGPAGGVVAVHRDGESIRFARQRWRRDHLAFELGWIETLEGELDGGFDAAVAVDLFRDAADSPSKCRAIDVLCRVVRPGGAIVVICTDRNRLEDVTDRLEAMGIDGLEVLDPDPVLLWGGAIGHRRGDDAQDDGPKG